MTQSTDTPTTSKRSRAVMAGALALGVAAAGFGGIAATNAYFTATASVTGESLKVGTVALTAGTAASSAPLKVVDMLPGDTASTAITVTNTGNAPLYFSVTTSSLTGSSALQGTVAVTISDGTVSHSDTLTNWVTGSLYGFSLGANASTTITVTVALPGSASNSLQGTAAGFDVAFTATQQRNVTAPAAGFR